MLRAVKHQIIFVFIIIICNISVPYMTVIFIIYAYLSLRLLKRVVSVQRVTCVTND